MSDADEAPKPASPIRKLKLPILVVVAVVLVGTSIFLAQRGSKTYRDPTEVGSASGSAAIRAPGAPALDDAKGVRISGTVIDGAGVPVAAAEVSAELEHGVPDKALSVGSGSAAPKVHVGSPTIDDGKFSIAGLEPGRYRLRVTGTGLLPAEVRYVPVPSDEVRIVVARQVKITGKVIDGTTVVPNAHVGLRGEAIGGTIEARTDSQGAFTFSELPEGRYQLYAWQGALAARSVRVNRLGAGPFEPIELRLESGAIVVGKVIDRDANVGVVAAIELRPVGDDQAPRYARSGDDGVFRIEGIPHGEWIADAFAPGYTSPGGVTLDAGRGIPELALVRGGTIEGRILDGDGNPVSGATVRALQSAHEYSAAVDQDKLRRFSGRMSAPVVATPTTSAADPTFIPRGELGVTTGPIPPIPPPGAQIATRQASIDSALASTFVAEPAPLEIPPDRAPIWTTAADGKYRVRGLPKGKAVVLALAPGFAEARSRQVTIDVNQTVTGIDIVLTAGTIISGKVTDQHNSPVVGAQVTATPELGVPLVVFTDTSGLYKLGPLTGDIELAASAYGHADTRKKLDLPAAKGTTPADRREDLTLVVADAIMTGTIDDETGAAIAGATIEVIAADRRSVSGNDGTFTIDMLAAGSHRVRVTHPDYPPVELDALAAPAGRERARLRIPLGGAVEGVVLDNAGTPISGLTIEAEGPRKATADATTDKAGLFKLGPLVPGRWKIVIKQPGYLPLTHDVDVTASRAPGQTSVRDIRLELARGALVGGTVRDARGQRAIGAKIVVQRADATGPTCEGTTDTQGEFRIHDCPTGELAVTATKLDSTGTTRASVRPGDEVLSLAIDLR